MSGKWARGCLRECVGTFLQPAHWSVLVLILSCSVVSESLQPHGLYPARLLCPWELWSKNIGAGCHFLFQGILLTQGSYLRLLHWQAGSLPLEPPGKPMSPLEYHGTLLYDFSKGGIPSALGAGKKWETQKSPWPCRYFKWNSLRSIIFILHARSLVAYCTF